MRLPLLVLTGEPMYRTSTHQFIMKDEWLSGQETTGYESFTGTSWHLQWHSLLHGFQYFKYFFLLILFYFYFYFILFLFFQCFCSTHRAWNITHSFKNLICPLYIVNNMVVWTMMCVSFYGKENWMNINEKYGNHKICCKWIINIRMSIFLMRHVFEDVFVMWFLLLISYMCIQRLIIIFKISK
jgi:hypothetical protein